MASKVSGEARPRERLRKVWGWINHPKIIKIEIIRRYLKKNNDKERITIPQAGKFISEQEQIKECVEVEIEIESVETEHKQIEIEASQLRGLQIEAETPIRNQQAMNRMAIVYGCLFNIKIYAYIIHPCIHIHILIY